MESKNFEALILTYRQKLKKTAEHISYILPAEAEMMMEEYDEHFGITTEREGRVYEHHNIDSFKKAIEGYEEMAEKIKNIDKELEKYWDDDAFVRQLSPEEVEYTHKMSGQLTRNMGDELYRLPGGAITGSAGVKQFNDAVKEAAIKQGYGLPNE